MCACASFCKCAGDAAPVVTGTRHSGAPSGKMFPCTSTEIVASPLHAGEVERHLWAFVDRDVFLCSLARHIATRSRIRS